MNSCGFTLKSALSASKHVHFDSPEKPDSVIALFKSHGFSEKQILKVIKCRPQLLWASPEKTLLPKLEFFHSKGFSYEELAKILCVSSTILHRSLEHYTVPSFNYLSDLFKSSETGVAAVKCNPCILCHDVETYVGPSIDVLRDIGVSERNIFLFLRMWYRSSKRGFGTFRSSVEAVKKMGISPLKSSFIHAVIAMEYGRINWESKVKIYRKWGWSEEEFLAAFRKRPLCMLVSKDKIMKTMDFLLNKMELESSVIAKRPDVIPLSMEKRFIPRAAVFQCLVSKNLVQRKSINLVELFVIQEKAFLRRFVNSFDDAPELLKLYREKLGISKMIKTSASRENDNL